MISEKDYLQTMYSILTITVCTCPGF